MTRLYPGLSTGMGSFVLIFGLLILTFGMVMVYEYFVLIEHYRSIPLIAMVDELYQQLTFFFLFILGALLFLRVHRLGWTILTGLFISMTIKGVFMMSGRSVYKLVNPGLGGFHDDINPSIQAEMVLLLVFTMILTAIMHFGAIRAGFKLSKKQVWLGWIAAGLLISADIAVKWFFDLERSVL
ncbi:MAG: hypothetical protein HEP71_00220 [Roseivirga sp.]|nr:hypothetical protein [Roseivirga sp.]